jgi:four helix bundle protein
MIKEQNLLVRRESFALRVIKLVDALPNTMAGRATGGKLIRSGMSVSANYRAACRARSRAEFVAKLGIVEEEVDETCHWLEIIIESRMLKERLVTDLLKEANEITAIIVASKKTAGRNNGDRHSKIEIRK